MGCCLMCRRRQQALPIWDCYRAFTRFYLDLLQSDKEQSLHLDGSLDHRHDILDALRLASVLRELPDRLHLVKLLERAFAQLSLHTQR